MSKLIYKVFSIVLRFHFTLSKFLKLRNSMTNLKKIEYKNMRKIKNRNRKLKDKIIKRKIDDKKRNNLPTFAHILSYNSF